MMKIKNLVEALLSMDQEAETRFMILTRDDDGVSVAMSADLKGQDLDIFIKCLKGAK